MYVGVALRHYRRNHHCVILEFVSGWSPPSRHRDSDLSAENVSSDPLNILRILLLLRRGLFRESDRGRPTESEHTSTIYNCRKFLTEFDGRCAHVIYTIYRRVMEPFSSSVCLSRLPDNILVS